MTNIRQGPHLIPELHIVPVRALDLPVSDKAPAD